ncbi:MAG: prolyl oligopeptidase family serine peptidase [Muribaculaceae bacterium]|nr:prolyl oligopeptidase family serine peptidase [Muribaculaceae bacterium]
MKQSFLLLLMATTIASQGMAQSTIPYPKAKTVNQVDEYFGVKVADPYRWLEDDNSAETAAWVEAENKVTQDYISKIPFRNALKDKLMKLQNYEKMGIPFKHHGKYYFYKNNGLQNQSVLYEMDSLDGTPREVLDPNKLSDDGTVALKSVDFSKDGRYMAYTISRSGSDWNEIYVKDMNSGKLLEDHIVWAKFTNASWQGNGFYYSAYDAPESELSSKNEYQKVYYHKLGTPQSQDELVFRSFEEPLMFHMAAVSDDERFVYMLQSDGDGNVLYVKDSKSENPRFIRLNNSCDFDFSPIGNDDKHIFVQTNENAPMAKVLAFDIDNLGLGKCRDFIAESDVMLTSLQMAGKNHFIVNYEKDAASHAYLLDKQGKNLGEIELPGIGSVGFSSNDETDEVFYNFTSYTTPGSIYSYDMATGKSKLFWKPNVKFDSDKYITEQIFYTSKDGTRVPMFVTHKKGMKLDGKNPTLLYAYGGFSISLNPSFSVNRIPFLENGGVYVVANIRGGAEYGDKWHRDGTKLKKQNVFDDFIAAAEFLIANKYTSSDKLAIMGGSNGGLLMGAVTNQRPDLFRAVIAQVGVMDMLRYHLFTIGWNWASDYGRSDDSKEMFEYLRAYSPLHNIKNDGTAYPAILVTTGDHDDRVVPAHSFKYAATLQAANTGNQPKLIRIDSKAGHGSGKPISKVIDEAADYYAFMMKNLGMKLK